MFPKTLLITWLLQFTIIKARIIDFNSDYELEFIQADNYINCQDEESVNLSNMNISRIPEGLVKSQFISSISLDNNSIEEVPWNVFRKITNLDSLNISRNRIPLEKLFSSDHPTIKTLILSHQYDSREKNGVEIMDFERYNEIPKTFDTGNSRFPQLERLDLSGLVFENLPYNMKITFPRLKHLYLNDRPVYKLDPKLFQDLPKTIKYLYFKRNYISFVNASYLGNLEGIYFDDNPIKSIFLRSENIRILSFSNCTIRQNEFNFIFYLPNLNSIDLSYNEINKFSEVNFTVIPRKLEYLSLSHNKLKHFPDLSMLNSLQSLLLSYNNIGNLKNEIPNLPSLKILILRGNYINEIEPLTFLTLPNLEKLDLAENGLKQLSYGWSTNTKLKYLNLNHNKFSSLKDMEINASLNLQDVFVKGNSFTRLYQNDLSYIPPNCIIHVI